MGKKWETWEDELIIKSYQEVQYSQIAELLGRTVSSVSNRIRKLGLKKQHDWTTSDLEFLKKNWHLPRHLLAELLGRSESAVRGQIRLMGGYKYKPWFSWSLSECDRLSELFGSYPTKIACRLFKKWAIQNGYPNRSHEAIKAKVSALGLSMRIEPDVYFSSSSLALLFGYQSSASIYSLLRDVEYAKVLSPVNQEGGAAGLVGDPDKSPHPLYFHRNNVRNFIFKFPGILDRHLENLDFVWIIDVLRGS